MSAAAASLGVVPPGPRPPRVPHCGWEAGPGAVEDQGGSRWGWVGAGCGGGLGPSCLFHPSVSLAWGIDHRKKCI